MGAGGGAGFFGLGFRTAFFGASLIIGAMGAIGALTIGALFLAVRFLATRFFAAPFFAAPLLADAFFFFFFAAAAILPRFAFFVFDLDFFAFFAIFDLPIVSADDRTSHADTHAGTAAVFACIAGGTSPPVAQSISSIGWTTGRAVPAAICVMQPTLPAAITSG